MTVVIKFDNLHYAVNFNQLGDIAYVSTIKDYENRIIGEILFELPRNGVNNEEFFKKIANKIQEMK